MCDHFSQKGQIRALAQFDWHKQEVNKSFCNRAVASSLRLTGLIKWAESSGWKVVLFFCQLCCQKNAYPHQARTELGLTACHAHVVAITPLLPCKVVFHFFFVVVVVEASTKLAVVYNWGAGDSSVCRASD